MPVNNAHVATKGAPIGRMMKGRGKRKKSRR